MPQPFLANGLPITAIWAFDYIPLVFDQNPDLYVRDPGTASSFIAIGAPLDRTARARQNLLHGRSGHDVLAAKMQSSRTSHLCRRRFLPLDHRVHRRR